MSRKDKRAKEAILKRIFKKGNISEEKKQEIREAIEALDVETILRNPSVLSGLKKDPSKLSSFVKTQDQKAEDLTH